MRDREQFSLFAPEEPAPPGFAYFPDILSRRGELELAGRLASLPFTSFEFQGFLGKRRTVSFGWRFAFEGAGTLLPAAPMPDYLTELRKLAAKTIGEDPDRYEHLLVTEYGAGAGIGWHKDRPVFGKTIAVSLLSTCRLRFRRRTGESWERKSALVRPRSLYLIDGEARSSWEHSIPPVDELRYSLTFRNLADPIR